MAKIFKYKKETVHLSSQMNHLETADMNVSSGSREKMSPLRHEAAERDRERMSPLRYEERYRGRMSPLRQDRRGRGSLLHHLSGVRVSHHHRGYHGAEGAQQVSPYHHGAEGAQQVSPYHHGAEGAQHLSPYHLGAEGASLVLPQHLETGTNGAGLSPQLLGDGIGVSPRKSGSGTRLSPRNLEAGIGWVDLQPDGVLRQMGVDGQDGMEAFQKISQRELQKRVMSSKKILEEDICSEKNISTEPEGSKKKRRNRRFRRRGDRRRGEKRHLERESTDDHEKRGDQRNMGRDNNDRRGKKRKLDGEDFCRRRDHNDVCPKLSPKSLDLRQVENYVLSDPSLNNKRRRIDQNSCNMSSKRGIGILGSPPRGSGMSGTLPSVENEIGSTIGIVYSPTQLRKLQMDKSSIKWPSFLNKSCKNRRGFWDPLIFHDKTAEEVRKKGSGAAAVNVTLRRDRRPEIGENREGLDNKSIHVEKRIQKDLLKPTLVSSRPSSTDLFKKDIKAIVRKTLSVRPKEGEFGNLFESEIENIDSPDNFDNFSGNESSEDLFNLPEPVPALKKDPSQNKVSSFADLPQPVPAQKTNPKINKKSTFEIIEAMKKINCEVRINPSCEIRDTIAHKARMLKKKVFQEENIRIKEKNTGDEEVNLSLVTDNNISFKISFNLSLVADNTITASTAANICVPARQTDDIVARQTDRNVKSSDTKIINSLLVDRKIDNPADNRDANRIDSGKSNKSADKNKVQPSDKETHESAEKNMADSTCKESADPTGNNVAEITQLKDASNKENKTDLPENRTIDPNEDIDQICRNSQIDKDIEKKLGASVTVEEMDTKEAALFLAWLPKETFETKVIDESGRNEELGNNTAENEDLVLKCDFGDFDVKYCFICEEYDHFMGEDCLLCKKCGKKLTVSDARGHFSKGCIRKSGGNNRRQSTKETNKLSTAN